jgi:hypothetical protein
MNCNKKLVLGKANDTPDKKVFCDGCYNSQIGPKVLGFGGSGPGSGLDKTSISEKPDDFKTTTSKSSTIQKSSGTSNTSSLISNNETKNNVCVACGKTAFMNEQVKAVRGYLKFIFFSTIMFSMTNVSSVCTVVKDLFLEKLVTLLKKKLFVKFVTIQN